MNEVISDRSHFVTGSQKHRDPRFPPKAFTEHGAIMAATVLNSPEAVAMSEAKNAPAQLSPPGADTGR